MVVVDHVRRHGNDQDESEVGEAPQSEDVGMALSYFGQDRTLEDMHQSRAVYHQNLNKTVADTDNGAKMAYGEIECKEGMCDNQYSHTRGSLIP